MSTEQPYRTLVLFDARISANPQPLVRFAFAAAVAWTSLFGPLGQPAHAGTRGTAILVSLPSRGSALLTAGHPRSLSQVGCGQEIGPTGGAETGP